MSKARLVITAVVVEGRSKSEVARDYEVSRYWVQQLVKRWYAEGETAYEPRSRRPRSSPQAVPAEMSRKHVLTCSNAVSRTCVISLAVAHFGQSLPEFTTSKEPLQTHGRSSVTSPP